MQPIWLIHWMSVGTNPSLTEVAHATRSPEDAAWLRRWNHRVWCLVYTFNTATRWRIGSTANPWRTRSANTLLLIPPGTPYWEDMLPDMHDPSEMAWVKFVGGDTAVRSLIPPGRRYAHFLDPERLAGSLLKEIVTICRERGQRGFWQAQSAFCLLLSRLQESEPVDGDEEATRRIGAPSAAAPPTGLVQRVNAYLPQCIAGPLRAGGPGAPPERFGLAPLPPLSGADRGNAAPSSAAAATGPGPDHARHRLCPQGNRRRHGIRECL